VIDAGPRNIGDLTALDIGFASRRPGSLGGALAGLVAPGGQRWGLAGVEVLRLSDGARTYFPYEGGRAAKGVGGVVWRAVGGVGACWDGV
jgi:hypothetical protein